MYDQDNNLILSIVDDEIEYIGDNVAATVRNGIKYIVIFDEDYSIEIEAAEEYVRENNIHSGKVLGGDGVLPNEAIKEIFHLPEDTKI